MLSTNEISYFARRKGGPSLPQQELFVVVTEKRTAGMKIAERELVKEGTAVAADHVTSGRPFGNNSSRVPTKHDDDDNSHLLPRGRVTTRQSGEPRAT